MTHAWSFVLWLEFEHTLLRPGDDPPDDFANVQVRLPGGRRYALNVWTFQFMNRARYPWPYETGVGELAEFLLPPDLFVARLDRSTPERVVGLLIAEGAMRDEWLCPPDDDRA